MPGKIEPTEDDAFAELARMYARHLQGLTRVNADWWLVQSPGRWDDPLYGQEGPDGRHYISWSEIFRYLQPSAAAIGLHWRDGRWVFDQALRWGPGGYYAAPAIRARSAA